jgi:hypothetical protein
MVGEATHPLRTPSAYIGGRFPWSALCGSVLSGAIAPSGETGPKSRLRTSSRMMRWDKTGDDAAI